MCGICASVVFVDASDRQTSCPCKLQNLKDCLIRRGPDSYNEVTDEFKGKLNLHFSSSVLHLRGSDLVTQPVTNETKSLFMWNGEIFTEELVENKTDSATVNSDTKFLAQQMFDAKNSTDILSILSTIEGPYAFIFYEASGLLWFGRDIFGRRSLLWNFKQSLFQLCSVAIDSHEEKWEEVPTVGVFCLDLNLSIESQKFVMHQFPWFCSASGKDLRMKFEFPVPDGIAEIRCDFKNTLPVRTSKLNTDVPQETSDVKLLSSMIDDLKNKLTKKELFHKLLNISDFKEEVVNFETVLSNAVRKRVEYQLNCCKNCYFKASKENSSISCHHSYTGVLFSGGLDSLVIAYLADRYVNPHNSIDLLNVAFAREKDVGNTPYGVKFDTPDRVTGKMGFEALKSLLPDRKWNFVEINITDSELSLKREKHISELLYPCCSVLDDSIGCALWFASRGKGYISFEDDFVSYQSPARVLLVGMGADEQLAGYSRHRAVFKNASWPGLIQEISLEIDRIGSRNLGRDDRIIADNGVESRYPFLDEKVVSFLNSLPIWIKANLNLERGIGEKLLLRLLAYKLGLVDSAMLPKRAIQFGSRIAKLENCKEKGSDVCVRLLPTR